MWDNLLNMLKSATELMQNFQKLLSSKEHLWPLFNCLISLLTMRYWKPGIFCIGKFWKWPVSLTRTMIINKTRAVWLQFSIKAKNYFILYSEIVVYFNIFSCRWQITTPSCNSKNVPQCIINILGAQLEAPGHAPGGVHPTKRSSAHLQRRVAVHSHRARRVLGSLSLFHPALKYV